MPRGDVPAEVAAIRQMLDVCLNTRDAEGRTVGNAKFGVYAFYD